ncbi:thermonuclease family protein [Desulfofustis glycolicus]|uniref:Endonuclease YncB, thermonuclease family n=1 Tax=Desulfofustis glycolicus DSM 9705 TaxID=1121409 RepID=A0A1M5UKI5_9BACT|nr:thermonuclease family protein [Desulfofustis glycolicus]SHH63430.1 Endonuclease YncB, thermonuclease family [Desulfofustis glycolicus DSM 9705]
MLMRLLLVFFVIITPVVATALEGKVVSVADGDTITVLSQGNQQTKIRLYGIDCPEDGQPFGRAAKKFTASLVAGKHVQVTQYDTDRYGRMVGVVTVSGRNINQSIIASGYAWQYRKYCLESFCSDWLGLEKQAKSAELGLWGENDPVPPWQWRTGTRNSSYQKASQGNKSSGSSYHGNVKSRVFHGPNCKYYNCKNCVIKFYSIDEAKKAGYRLHRECVKE